MFAGCYLLLLAVIGYWVSNRPSDAHTHKVYYLVGIVVFCCIMDPPVLLAPLTHMPPSLISQLITQEGLVGVLVHCCSKQLQKGSSIPS